MQNLIRYAAVAGGGAVGACLRFYMGGTILSRTAKPFPMATFVINVSGSFIIGFFLTLVTERIAINPNVRLAVVVGFVGAYTTFSTFEYETARLLEQNEYFYAFLNVALSFVIGFGAVWAGIVAAREIAGIPISSHAAYDRFEEQADITDAAQSPGAERDIRDSTIVGPVGDTIDENKAGT